MSYSNYLEAAILNHVFGGGDYTRPATLYVGLCTGVTEPGAISGEPSGNNYARVAVTNNSTNWPAATEGSKSNGTAITFPQASGSWGELIYVFIADAASGGHVLGYGPLDAAITPVNGDTVSFAVGDLDIAMS